MSLCCSSYSFLHHCIPCCLKLLIVLSASSGVPVLREFVFTLTCHTDNKDELNLKKLLLTPGAVKSYPEKVTLIALKHLCATC